MHNEEGLYRKAKEIKNDERLKELELKFKLSAKLIKDPKILTAYEELIKTTLTVKYL